MNNGDKPSTAPTRVQHRPSRAAQIESSHVRAVDGFQARGLRNRNA